MASIIKYAKVLAKRIYRPIKPIIEPLLKIVKIEYLLAILMVISLWGGYERWVEQKTYLKNLQEKTRIEQEISKWEKILETKPNYRDVLLRLALLHYQIYNQEKSQENWLKANYLDPNNQEVQKVGQIISSQALFLF